MKTTTLFRTLLAVMLLSSLLVSTAMTQDEPVQELDLPEVALATPLTAPRDPASISGLPPVFGPEDFETGAFPPALWNIYELNPNITTNWAESADYSHSPEHSALRSRTTEDPAGADTWLVTPAISLGSNNLLTFWERGSWANFYDYHGIWVSTSSCNPNDGQFVELAEVGEPRTFWVEKTYSLGAYSNDIACIAFVYHGYDAVDWYIDDVLVRDPAPDLRDSYKQATPKVLGDDHIDYTIVLRNSGELSAEGASMSDPLPAGTEFASGPWCSSGSCAYDPVAHEITWAGVVTDSEEVSVTFTVEVTGVLCGDSITNTATISDPIALEEVQVTALTHVVQQIFDSEDLEADPGGFVADPAGEWEWGLPLYPSGLAANSGQRVWGTDLDDDYDAATPSALVKSMTLPTDIDGTFIQWWEWLSLEDCCDEAYVEIESASNPVPTLIYGAYTGGPTPGQEAHEEYWFPVTLDVSPWAGELVTITFTLNPDNNTTQYPGWYIDDFAVHSGCPSPQVYVDAPFPLEATLCPGAAASIPITICNLGFLDLEWNITETDPQVSLILDDGGQDNGMVIRDPDTLTEFHTVIFNHYDPSMATFPLVLRQIHIHQDTDELAGKTIQLLVYTDSDGVDLTDASLIYAEEVQIENEIGWNYYNLTTPVNIDSPTHILIGFSNIYADGGIPWPDGVRYPLPLDDNTPQGRSYIAWMDTPSDPVDVTDLSTFPFFFELGEIGLAANWVVRGVTPSWISEDPVEGIVPMDQCQPVDITLQPAITMEPGQYDSEIHINSNDPVSPTVALPASLTVLMPAAILDLDYTIFDLTVDLMASVTGTEVINMEWDFGDGSGDAGPGLVAISHAYDNYQCYDLVITATNTCDSSVWNEEICISYFYYLPMILRN